MPDKSKKDDESFIESVDRRIKTDFRRMEDIEILADQIAKYIADELQSRFTVPSEKHFNHHDKWIPLVIEYVTKKIDEEKIAGETRLILKREIMKYVLLGTFGILGFIFSIGLFVYFKMKLNSP